MDWRKKFKTPTVGDKVRVIKVVDDFDMSHFSFSVGDILEILEVHRDSDGKTIIEVCLEDLTELYEGEYELI